MITLIVCTFPAIVNAAAIDQNVEGYAKLLDMMKVYVRGAGAIILLVGSADFFISFSHENTDRLVRAMQLMGGGFFLILADSLVQAIGNANGTETFTILLNAVGLIISFIGAVLSFLGAYRTLNSIKERNADARSKSLKLLFCGLMLVAISQSVSSFLS